MRRTSSADNINIQSKPDSEEDTSSTTDSSSEPGRVPDIDSESNNDQNGSQSVNNSSDTPHDTPTTAEAPRRSTRVRKAPSAWWKATAAIVCDPAPETFSATVRSSDSISWMDAMKCEASSLQKNKTWTLVPRTEARNILTPKWVFRKKEVVTPQGVETVKYKARLCARGFQQIYGIVKGKGWLLANLLATHHQGHKKTL